MGGGALLGAKDTIASGIAGRSYIEGSTGAREADDTICTLSAELQILCCAGESIGLSSHRLQLQAVSSGADWGRHEGEHLPSL